MVPTRPRPEDCTPQCAGGKTHEELDYEQIHEEMSWTNVQDYAEALSEFRHDLGDNALLSGHLKEAGANYALAEFFGALGDRGLLQTAADGPKGLLLHVSENLEGWVPGDVGQPHDGSEPPNTAQDGTHGNSHMSTRPAYGYIMVGVRSGEILKYGETVRGTRRYSRRYLTRVVDGGARLRWAAKGTKAEMHAWQHLKILSYVAKYGQRPRLNKCNY
jgi:hypothetical protein